MIFRFLMSVVFLLFLTLQVSSEPKKQDKVGTYYELNVEVTAYCQGTTTSRGTAVCWGTIAVDPQIISYYSYMYVPGYGYGYALDTGGAVNGNIIDVYMPNYGDCINWGRKYLTIKIYPEVKYSQKK